MINVKRLVYAVLMVVSIPAFVLLLMGLLMVIMEGGHKAYEALFLRPYCTESTEATVLYYEGQLAAEYLLTTPHTVVEISGENGKHEEVKLRGLYGNRKGDILELHYNPENIEQFYIGEIQYAPKPPKPPKPSETTLDKINNVLDVVSNVLMVLVTIPVIILYAYDIVPDKNNEKNES